MNLKPFTYLFISILFLCATKEAPELPPILRTDKPQRGIYLDFKEFLNDAPSIHSEFELKSRSKSKQYWFGGSDYDLVINDSLVAKKQKRKFWGLSTGDSVFVNVANYQANRGFVKFVKLGRYCYLKGATMETYVVPTGVAVSMATVRHITGFVLNINNGNFYALDKGVMQLILKKDELLSKEYEAERKPKRVDVMFSYLDRYNSRHTDDIGKEKLVQIVIYRRDRKQKADTVTLVTSDSLRVQLPVNEVQTIYSRNQKISLCVNDHCTEWALAYPAINYFECSFQASDAKPVLAPVKKEAAEFYVERIRKGNEKPD